ncbi:TIGR03943 family putative permease subunit [Streptoalloteichus hindustanus]|uniref:TIGR03943 family protein n=1 Tax=Streptoalloteichus hindustanus TaxID=2017 RepID=A0A1M5BHQ7_STRHI|nr:TIGR03943 family protein [Streptoalloteichus hindustanus]SHF41995.1 TIGR03943 family protein [Streptoalloteichus hindustanus]
MRRETQNLVLALLGGALLKIAWNGTYLRYVKPGLLPWLVATGVVMVALAVVAIVRDLRAARTGGAVPAPACADGGEHGQEAGAAHEERATAGEPHPTADGHGQGHGHDHGHREPRSPWLLLLPVLAIFLVAPPALGADAVNRAGAGNDPGTRQEARGSAVFPPLPEGEAIPMPIGEVVTRTVWDDSGTLDNRTIKITGFLVRRDDGRRVLARMVIRCCAADASPRTIVLAGRDAELAAYSPDTWLEVVGRVVPGSGRTSADHTPTLTVESARPVAAPADPYE